MGETLITELMGDAPERQEARRLAVAEFRPRRTVIGLVTAIGLTAVAGVVTFETVAFMLGRPFRLLPAEAAMREVSWDDPGVLGAGAGLVLGGLLLVLAGLPGRVRLIALRAVDERSAGGLVRATLQRSFAGVVLGVPGVSKAKVRFRGRFRRRLRVVVWASTRYRNPANLADLIRTAVIGHMASVGLMDDRRVDVRLSWRKD